MKHDPVMAELDRHLATEAIDYARDAELEAETIRQIAVIGNDPELLGESVWAWMDSVTNRPNEVFGRALIDARNGDARGLLDLIEQCVEAGADYAAREMEKSREGEAAA